MKTERDFVYKHEGIRYIYADTTRHKDPNRYAVFITVCDSCAKPLTFLDHAPNEVECFECNPKKWTWELFKINV